jgi:hypothetical protein
MSGQRAHSTSTLDSVWHHLRHLIVRDKHHYRPTTPRRAPPSWWVNRFSTPHYYVHDPFLFGPSQYDDLGMLFAIVKEIRPRTLIEIGCHRGDSTRALLSAADADAHLFSFDPAPDAAAYMRTMRLEGQRINASSTQPLPSWTYAQLDGRRISPMHVEFRLVDFAFLDAAHDLERNRAIFRRLQPLFAEDATFVLHDTGVWSKQWLDAHPPNTTWRFGRWLKQREADATWRVGRVQRTPTGEEYYEHPHNAAERAFVRWVENSSDYRATHYHSMRFLRNGLTVFQRTLSSRKGVW